MPQGLNLIWLILLIHFLPVFNPTGNCAVFLSALLPAAASCTRIPPTWVIFSTNLDIRRVGNFLPHLVCSRLADRRLLKLHLLAATSQLWVFFRNLPLGSRFQIDEYLEPLLLLLGLCPWETWKYLLKQDFIKLTFTNLPLKLSSFTLQCQIFQSQANSCGVGCGCSTLLATTCLHASTSTAEPLNGENILVCDWPGQCRLPAIVGCCRRAPLIRCCWGRYSPGLRSFPATLRLPAKHMIHFLVVKIPPDRWPGFVQELGGLNFT